MIYRYRWFPHGIAVAVFTNVCRLNVCCSLARRNGAVVTRRTATQHLRVIHRYRRLPDNGAVTILTNVSRLDMCQSLASGLSTVVTSKAITNDVVVVEVGRCPGRGRMAVIAVVTTRYVQQVLADCNGAVVTR